MFCVSPGHWRRGRTLQDCYPHLLLLLLPPPPPPLLLLDCRDCWRSRRSRRDCGQASAKSRPWPLLCL
eukprot:2023158-Rhodomonas_salina.1